MTTATLPTAPWRPVELTLTARQDHPDPYGGLDVHVVFSHPDGLVLRRPAFWDGGRTWRVRFSSPGPVGEWSWTSSADAPDPGLHGVSGTVVIGADAPRGRFERHGFWRMSEEGRHLVHADVTSALLVGDTAWALPWRATPEQVEVYARDRAAKGFNAVLLMSLQPDSDARGPEDRGADEGFGVAFDDLPQATLRALRPDYFQDLDRLLDVLRAHDLVPVLQPVFQGFGWKGLRAAGGTVPPAEYARYCRYLVARYGAGPVVWLVGADGSGEEPQTLAGGREVQAWDDHRHPTGIHYRPFAHNRAHQDADWLDFQWCQTGHRGDHLPERVADMARNQPEKAVANGEPSYENTGRSGFNAGWWQGHEAWSNLCAGATMGVVYGAGSLWQWQLRPDETGQSTFFSAPGAGWREALDFEGSTYPGVLARVLQGLPFTGARPSWEHSTVPRGLVVPGRFLLVYAHDGGDVRVVRGAEVPRPYRVIDPATGEVVARGVREEEDGTIPDPGGAPRVFVCCDDFSGSAIA